MSTDKVDYVLNYVFNELSDREQKAVLNKLAFRLLGLRLHARDTTPARTAEHDIPVVGVVDNNSADDETEQKAANDPIYLQKIQLLNKVINNDTWATKGREFSAFAAETKILLETFTLPELEKLDGAALLKMCRIVQQSRDPGVTNRTAYIRASYSNVINGVDYKKRWTLKYKLEHGEITKDEYLTRIYYLN